MQMHDLLMTKTVVAKVPFITERYSVGSEFSNIFGIDAPIVKRKKALARQRKNAVSIVFDWDNLHW